MPSKNSILGPNPIRKQRKPRKKMYTASSFDEHYAANRRTKRLRLEQMQTRHHEHQLQVRNGYFQMQQQQQQQMLHQRQFNHAVLQQQFATGLLTFPSENVSAPAMPLNQTVPAAYESTPLMSTSITTSLGSMPQTPQHWQIEDAGWSEYGLLPQSTASAMLTGLELNQPAQVLTYNPESFLPLGQQTDGTAQGTTLFEPTLQFDAEFNEMLPDAFLADVNLDFFMFEEDFGNNDNMSNSRFFTNTNT